MLVDVFRAVVDLWPLRRHYDRINATYRVNGSKCLRGPRLTAKVCKFYAFQKLVWWCFFSERTGLGGMQLGGNARLVVYILSSDRYINSRNVSACFISH